MKFDALQVIGHMHLVHNVRLPSERVYRPRCDVREILHDWRIYFFEREGAQGAFSQYAAFSSHQGVCQPHFPAADCCFYLYSQTLWMVRQMEIVQESI